jgi:hypothetical protein
VRARLAAWSSVAALLAGCLEYSPHQLPTDASERDLNRKAIERILAGPAAPMRFAVIGDTQRAFDEAEEVVEAINRRGDVLFAVQIGDFTNLGTWPEFRLMHRIFSRLHVPWVVVAGYHEFIGNAAAIYGAMFGPTDFAFTLGRVRFVLFDSNSSRHGYDGTVPDVGWVAEQLAPDAEHDVAIAFAHVAPGEGKDFDDRLVEPLLEEFRRGKVDLSISGHASEYRPYELEGVRIVLVDSLEHHSYLVVTQRPDGGFDFEQVGF